MTSTTDDGMRQELKKTGRISDQMCTAHAVLRDRYYWKGLALDLLLLVCSVWLNAMVFVEPAIGQKLSPVGVDSKLWLGLLAVSCFFLGVAQVRVNWKGSKQEHAKAMAFYSAIKLESRHLLADQGGVDAAAYKSLVDRYGIGGSMLVAIPDGKFLSLKKLHKLKVLISRYLDRHPAVSLPWLRLRLWWRDNRARLPNATPSEEEKDGKDKH